MELPAKEPAPTSSQTATTKMSAKCGACGKDTDFFCNGCGNMGYCDETCQKKDTSVHKALCDSFNKLPPRPGDKFYRAIFFPADANVPHFLWLEFKGSRIWMRISIKDRQKHLGDGPTRSVYFDYDVKFDRDLQYQIEMHHRENFLIDGSMVNSSLAPFVSAETARQWRGPLLVQGGKYSHMECDFDKIDKEDYPSGCTSASELKGVPMIPRDLDTTSFGPIVSYIKHRGEQQRWLYLL